MIEKIKENNGQSLAHDIQRLTNKINEIIEYLNEKKKMKKKSEELLPDDDYEDDWYMWMDHYPGDSQ